jgi:hypothetical protein
MSTQAELVRLGVQDFARRFRREMIPITNRFSYFSAVPLGEDDVKEYLEDPIAALPAGIQARVGQACVFLVPYLERANGKTGETVTFERPEQQAQASSAHFVADGEAFVVLAIRDREVADCHYAFYRSLATLAFDTVRDGAFDPVTHLIRDELRNGVHGEVDEEAWKLKTQLIRKQSDAGRDSKLFRAYARQATIDTLTLYLHGICCDIDVDAGPRQLASRHVRRRIELLREACPPPEGYAVFPEELSD